MIQLIDKSERRGVRRLDAARDSELPMGDFKIRLDPMGNTPMKIYYVHLDEVPKFKSSSWRPPLYLTEQEQRIVENPHKAVLLLGRSGTGSKFMR